MFKKTKFLFCNLFIVTCFNSALAATIAVTIPQESSQTKIRTESDAEFLARAQADLAATSREPQTIKFQNVRVGQYRNSRGTLIPTVCGEINAKNLFGKYVGFHRFWYFDRERYSIQDMRDVGPVPWVETAKQVCDSK